MMIILNQEIYDQPAVIYPPKLQEIHDFLVKREYSLNISKDGGGKIYAQENAIDDDKKDRSAVEITDDKIGIVNIYGTIVRRGDFVDESSGLISADTINKKIDRVINDGALGLFLHVDSPGGAVSGVEAISDRIFQLRQDGFPSIVYVDGIMMSGAYWIGSAANEIITSKSAGIGSIGVYTIHVDQTKFDEKIGVVRTVISAGRYKAVGNAFNPLSDDDKSIIQERLDSIYKVFLESVARNRAIEVDKAKEIAEGKVFTGEQAVETELIDKIGSFDDAMQILKEEIGKGMNKEELKTKFPEVYESIYNEGVSKQAEETASSTDEKVKEAIQEERDRCVEILKIEGKGTLPAKIEAIENGDTKSQVFERLYKSLTAENQKAVNDEQSRLEKNLTQQDIPVGKPGNAAKSDTAADYLAEFEKLKGEGMPINKAAVTARRRHPKGYAEFLKNSQVRRA